MDTLFHFVFPLIIILAARPNIKHKITIAIIFALLASLFIDLDHFGPLLARGTFHNVFVTLLIPAALFVLAMKFEKKGNNFKNMSLILLLVLFSHPIADMFTEGGVALFYPITDQRFDFTGLSVLSPIPINTGSDAYIVSTAGVGLTIYFLMLLGIIFVEDFVTILKKEKRIDRAIEKTIKKEESRIEKDL